MNLLSPRLIIVGVSPAPARRQGNVWVHVTEMLRGEALLSTYIDVARSDEWKQVRQTNRSTIERLRTLADVHSPVPGKAWPELVDELLAMDPTQLKGQPQLNAVKELSPMLKLASDVVSRPSVIGFLKEKAPVSSPKAESLFPAAKLAKELARSPRLLEANSVSFIRVSLRSASGNVDDASDQAFDDLMREVMSQLTSVAPNDHAPKEGPRLLVGETGSGKSEFARALHQQLRADADRRGAFRSVNIAAVAPALLESRLRGYSQGAFTDAKSDQPGWFEQADGGTLFLDEIQAAPMDFQVQLLDLLSPVSDTVEVERIGSKDGAPKRYRVRVVMATNESEASLLAKGRLRKDLAYRIRARIELKSLAERLRADTTGDLLSRLLRLHRWRSASALQVQGGRIVNSDADLEARLRSSLLPEIDGETIDLLKSHHWRGNLREFERVCFDAFLEYDRTGSPDWVGTFRAAFGVVEEDVTSNIVEGAVSQARVVREIETLLVANEFNVSAVQDRLALYKKKSPLALKSFLRANVAYLNLEKWKSRKAQRLLGRFEDGGR